MWWFNKCFDWSYRVGWISILLAACYLEQVCLFYQSSQFMLLINISYSFMFVIYFVCPPKLFISSTKLINLRVCYFDCFYRNKYGWWLIVFMNLLSTRKKRCLPCKVVKACFWITFHDLKYGYCWLRHFKLILEVKNIYLGF